MDQLVQAEDQVMATSRHTAQQLHADCPARLSLTQFRALLNQVQEQDMNWDLRGMRGPHRPCTVHLVRGESEDRQFISDLVVLPGDATDNQRTLQQEQASVHTTRQRIT